MTNETTDLLVEGWLGRFEDEPVEKMEALAKRVGIAEDSRVVERLAYEARWREPVEPSPVMAAMMPLVAREAIKMMQSALVMQRLTAREDQEAVTVTRPMSHDEGKE
jgi:hypothetical protein